MNRMNNELNLAISKWLLEQHLSRIRLHALLVFQKITG